MWLIRFVTLNIVKGLGLAAWRFFAALRMTVGGDQLILVTPKRFLGPDDELPRDRLAKREFVAGQKENQFRFAGFIRFAILMLGPGLVSEQGQHTYFRFGFDVCHQLAVEVCP